MFNYDNDKIRIPNETYCPSKIIQFNNSTIITQSSNNNNNNINNIKANTNLNLNINIFSQDNSSEEGVTISPIKSIITSASSKPQTIIQPQCKLEKFLPPKSSPHHKTLVLDLDETLIHSYFDCSSPRPADLSYDIQIEKKKIHVNSIMRPGAREFLENVAGIFEIVIFTASLSEYANPLLDFIDKNKKCKYRLYREHCCSYNNGFTNSFTKDLKKLDRDMKNLIIIDNNPKSYMLNKENGIPIKTWVEDINDRELYKLIPYLLFLGNEKITDVRPWLKQVNSGNTLNYDKFDKIILQYKLDNKQNTMENQNNNTEKKDFNNKENKNNAKICLEDSNNTIFNNKGNNYFIESNNTNDDNLKNPKIKLNENDNKNIIKENKKENINKNKNKDYINKTNIINSNTLKENNKKANNKPINNEKNNKGNNDTKNYNKKTNNINNDNNNDTKFNKNKVNEKNKQFIKNKSSNDMSNNITINFNFNFNNINNNMSKESANNQNFDKNNKANDKNNKISYKINKSNNENKDNQYSIIIKEKKLYSK